MPSQFFGLNIAGSGLRAFQASLNTTANNISNVQTEGYTRQTTNLESTDPLRVYSRYGSTGTGVDVISITQERNLYYDTKYWQNSASSGFFSQKLHYLDQMQELIRNDDIQEGFSSIFKKMFNSLDTLTHGGSDKDVRTQFINQAQSLCTYFNALSIGLRELQENCDEEIKTTVSAINSIGEKIATLNKQINMIEMRGSHANELRDQRALLVDELSGMVNVETQEFQVHNSYGQDLGGTNYRVIINGQVLVDGNDYRTLECISTVYKNNLSDAEGMYSIVWEDTKMDFAATTGNASGTLKALFDVRDGNNKENLRGTITGVTKEADINIKDDNGKVIGTKKVTKLTISNANITDLNALNIPEKGQITIGGRHYTYDGWSAEVDGNGVKSYTLNMTEVISGAESLKDKTLECGKSVSAMGVPYYQAQINEFIRNFVEAFNNIERYGLDGKPAVKQDGTKWVEDTSKYGVDNNDNLMGSFFVSESARGEINELEDYTEQIRKATEAAEKKKKEELDAGNDFTDEQYKQNYTYDISSDNNTYYKVTGYTVRVNDKSLRDPNYFSTTTNVVDGQDRQDLSIKLKTLEKDVKMFRGDGAESFLSTLISDITVDVQKNEIYTKNYTNILQVIGNQRTSVSGVDEDEEAMNMIRFQNAYNLASKMISVMSEIYNKLINETGVT